MGYTHYFSLKNVPQIDEHTKDELQHALDLVKSDFDHILDISQLSADKIFLNGIGDESHETFVFSLGKTGFNFCKTARKEYDYPVSCILLILKYYLGESLELSSDGFCAGGNKTDEGKLIYNLDEEVFDILDGSWGLAVDWFNDTLRNLTMREVTMQVTNVRNEGHVIDYVPIFKEVPVEEFI